MDERAYVEQKQDSWKRLSDALEQARAHGLPSLPRGELRALGGQYRAVVSDLAFARSQGASEGLVTYLNELAGRSHGVIYAARTARARGAISFLLRDFPVLFRASARYALVAALVFAIGWGTAAYTAATDPAASGRMLPEGMRARHGDDPAYVPDPAAISSQIMTNNIKVGIYSFAAGVTAGLVTVVLLFYNGLAIGAVAAAVVPSMGPLRFWSLILPHGIIELTAIFICGGAGLMIGSAIIAPGNLRRADSVRMVAGDALRLFAGTLPFFVIAGTIEGFITPSVLPPWSKLVFAGVTAVGLVLYLGFAGRPARDRIA